MSGNNMRGSVKVVIINTHYVETDAGSFKSVVQELTGKDSTVADVAPGKRQSGGAAGGKEKSVLLRDSSFKELERLIMEMAPVDELYRLWAD